MFIIVLYYFRDNFILLSLQPVWFLKAVHSQILENTKKEQCNLVCLNFLWVLLFHIQLFAFPYNELLMPLNASKSKVLVDMMFSLEHQGHHSNGLEGWSFPFYRQENWDLWRFSLKFTASKLTKSGFRLPVKSVWHPKLELLFSC